MASVARHTPALIISDAGSGHLSRTCAELSAACNRAANGLRGQGIAPGDRVILMLDNQVELWELMLACIKLRAVMVPTTTQMTATALADRVERAEAAWVVASAENLAKFARVGEGLRLVHIPGVAAEGAARTAPEVAGHTVLSYDDAASASSEHTHTSYPVGHLTTVSWIGLEPGDVHLNVASPGWAKHAWSTFFAPWIAEATIFVHNARTFDPVALMADMDEFGVTETTLQVADTPGRKLVIGSLGRADDVFTSSDYEISPFELESVLVQHPAVVEAAIVPTPDEVRLAVPRAFVTLAAAYEPAAETARDMLQHALSQPPPYKRARRIEFLEEELDLKRWAGAP